MAAPAPGISNAPVHHAAHLVWGVPPCLEGHVDSAHTATPVDKFIQNQRPVSTWYVRSSRRGRKPVLADERLVVEIG